jgi:SAM-dependent methyltransferase
MDRIVCAWLLLLPLATAWAHAEETGLYTRKTPGRGGIGKVYMGREISSTLGHRGIVWLEREERQTEERPDLLVTELKLAPDWVVADIGAGSGYFTFRLAPLLSEGKVLAVDIQPQMLAEVERRSKRLGTDNVETVLGSLTDPGLGDSSVDAALIVDAYHEFSHPREMMEAIFRALKPGGLLFLVEYRAEDPEVPMLALHKMTEAQARREMSAVGLEFVENRDGLPWQHLLVFRRPAGR